MIEAVPNVSEGRDGAVVEDLAEALRSTSGVFLLNYSSDVDHNRSVFTYVADDSGPLFEATMRLFEIAVREIDLRRHQGAHPRVGAVDVTPFVPLRGSSMEECVALAKRVGQAVGERFAIPVYLYEEAATEDYRRPLPAIRSGGFEGFPEKILDPRWTPDFGPKLVHPRAGVSVIGARIPLIAFNVQLATDRMDVATKIARSVRTISGGLQFVRALPIMLAHRGIVQVSMNLLDYRLTPIHVAFERVQEEAARHGVDVLSSEIVGLVPEDALFDTAAASLRIENFQTNSVLEKRIARVVGRPLPE
ncbi:MAG: glutamate formimidoyltransferase [Acidobacteriota bacterium]